MNLEGVSAQQIQRINQNEPAPYSGFITDRPFLEKCVLSDIEKDVWKAKAESFKDLSSDKINKDTLIGIGIGTALGILLMEFAR